MSPVSGGALCQLQAYLCQQNYPLAIRPYHMVNLGSDSLPGQFWGPQARLEHTVRTLLAVASPHTGDRKMVREPFQIASRKKQPTCQMENTCPGLLGPFHFREFNLRPSQGGITQDAIPQHILCACSLLSTVKGATGNTKETKGMVSAFRKLTL